MCETSLPIGIVDASRRASGSTTRSSLRPSAVTRSFSAETAAEPWGRAPSGRMIVPAIASFSRSIRVSDRPGASRVP